MISAGKLRHQIAIWRRVYARGEGGVRSVGLVRAGEHWASVEPMTAREYVTEGLEGTDVTHRIQMRHTLDAPTTEDEIEMLSTGRRYEITGLRNEGERDRVLTIFAVARSHHEG